MFQQILHLSVCDEQQFNQDIANISTSLFQMLDYYNVSVPDCIHIKIFTMSEQYELQKIKQKQASEILHSKSLYYADIVEYKLYSNIHIAYGNNCVNNLM